jgi:hypothetical protein
MQKQDKAFSSWLNDLLVPGTQDRGPGAAEDEAAAAGALNDRRLAAVMQGALVACYRCGGRGSPACTPPSLPDFPRRRTVQKHNTKIGAVLCLLSMRSGGRGGQRACL